MSARVPIKPPRRFGLPLRVAWLAGALPVAAGPVISEFMASNSTTLKDGNGSYSDWVEIWNEGDSAANLDGWKLTDASSTPSKFVFPAITLAAGQRLVVMCSGRTGSTGASAYVDPLGYLHTNFALSAGGEYLALIRPDGTKSTEFAPFYPPQSGDLGYGLDTSSDDLVGAAAQARYVVPAGSAYDTASPDWKAVPYNDSAWSLAAGPGLGFEAGTPVAYWRFDEGAGAATASDSAGGGYHGVLSGSASLGGGGRSVQTEGAVAFSNTLGKVTVPYSAALNPAVFTFAAWVYPAGSTGNYQSVITSRQDSSPAKGYVLYITPSNNWEFWTARSGQSAWTTVGGGPASYGEWTHVAFSRDASGTNRIWINGVLKDTATGTFGINTTYPLHIGAGNQDGGGFRFNGRVDDATFWNTALDTALVQQHRDATGGSFATPAYGGHYQTNVQSVLQTANPGLYARYNFSVADPSVLGSLSLRMKYDDGFVAYLNGTEVARGNLTGNRSYNSVADSDRSDSAAVVWEETDLTSAGLPLLVAGSNTLAIHATRRSTGHQEFLLNPQLRATTLSQAAFGYFANATPGLSNAAIISPGPEVTDVSHTPAEPLPGDSITVIARVKPRLGPIQSVVLTPRVQYNAEGAPLAMTDTGPWPGATDGSRLYGVTLPNCGGAAVRQMLRYHITATDSAARAWRLPFVTDTSNDDGKSQSPQYYGTVVRDPSLGTPAMPVLQWFTQDVANSDTRTGSRASCFYQGRFYDNIYVRQRGGYTSWGSQKFNFNRGDGLHVDGNPGNAGEVNMNSAGADSSYLRPVLAFDIWRACGHEASSAHLVAMYRNGSFQRMSSMIEQVDGDLLDRYGLDPDGALYKFVQRIGETPNGNDYSNSPALGDTLYGVEKKTRLNEDLTDLDGLVAGISQTDAAARDAYLFRHLNIPNFVNFMAVRNLTGDGDTNRKNFYLHRESDGSGEWRLIPWDKDFTFGLYYGGNTPNPWNATRAYYCDPGGTNQWCVLFEAGYQNPWIREMVARRIRRLADDVIGPPGTAYDTTVFESRLEAIRATCTPLPNGVGMSSGYNSRPGIDSWLATHRANTYQTYGPGGAYQLVSAAATASPQVDLLSADPLPATGNQDHEHIRLSNSGGESVDVSGWTLWNPGKTSPFFTFPSGTVIPPASMPPLNRPYIVRKLSAFRARPGAASLEFVLGEYGGRLSARGETIELRDGPLPSSRLVSSLATPSTPTAAQQFLRVTELMFAPVPPSPAELAAAPGTAAGDYEFIELRNTGAATLDLTNCAFTDGIDFVFPALSLASGRSVLVVKNPAAFEARYGTGFLIAGAYGGALDNAGERIRLEDAAGETVLDFSYDPSWFPPTGAGGRSLVVRDAAPSYATYDVPTHWAISSTVGGTPGAADNGDFAHHYTGWLHDHFTAAEQTDPLLAAPASDADGDGMGNLTEYAFGRDPRAPDHASLAVPAVIQQDGAGRLAITFVRRHRAVDLTYVVETAETPAGPWQAGAWTETGVEALDGQTERVVLETPFPPARTRWFARIRVTKP